MLMSDQTSEPPRRLVLIDFDWNDADLLPQLVQTPGVNIRLVAGARRDDPGVRAAALCGLPRTLDLADLTREIFDLALVGERSPRRQPLDRLLRVLGTDVESPRGFVHRGRPFEGNPPDPTPGKSAEDASSVGTSPDRHAELLPAGSSRRMLLAPEAFSTRLRTAVDRQREAGLCFGLYRLTFEGPEQALAELLRTLPDRLRDTDAACCPSPHELLLLCAGTPQDFGGVRRRIEALWHEAWTSHAGSGPPPTIVDERVELDLVTP